MATASVEIIFTLDPVAVMSISSPAAAPDARMSIPPAVASTTIASAADSVAFNTIDPPVFVILISSVAAPTASMSIPPAEALIRIASTAFWLDAIFTWPAPSTSIPPADACRLIALAAPSVAERFTDPPVLMMSMSCPAAPAGARMSIPPASAVMTIESATFSPEERISDPAAESIVDHDRDWETQADQ